jgi:hypothetical protein
LAIDAGSGQITGTPTGTGTSHATISASNGAGGGSAALTIIVDPAVPAFPALNCPTTANGTVGAPFTYQISATNSPTRYFAWCYGATGTAPPMSSLPGGLSYDAVSGVLSGIPTAAGTYMVCLAAMNGTVTGGGVTTGVPYLTLTVAAAPAGAASAANDSATTGEGAAVTVPVLANDSDSAGHALSVVSVGSPAHGTATINGDNTITYAPVAGYIGADGFSYAVSDGNGAVASAAVAITVQGQAPTVSAAIPASGPVGTIVGITGTNLTGASAVTVGGVAASFTAVSPLALTVVVPAGAGAGGIHVTTAAGTAATAFTVVADTAPAITSFAPTGGPDLYSVTVLGSGFTSASAVAFNGTAATFTVVSDGEIITTVPNGATNGPISVTTGAGSAQSAQAFTIGATAVPAITTMTPANGPAGTSVTITGANFTYASAVSFNGSAATPFVVVSPTTITVAVPAGATNGAISVTTPGGTATSATGFVVTSATAAPTIGALTPDNGPVGTSVTITGSNFTGATAVGFAGTPATFTVVSPTSIATAVPAGAPSGAVTVTTSGGTATSTASFTVTVAGAPAITGFSPGQGAAGTSVTISGSHFTGATAVTFGGVAATYNVQSANSITATVPAGAATGTIAVTAPGGVATSATSFTVVTVAAPTITSFTPSHGPVGTGVTLTGSAFTGVTDEAFHGQPVTTYTFVSDTSLFITAPVNATTGVITVTTPGGTATSASVFTVDVPALAVSRGGNAVTDGASDSVTGTTAGTVATVTYTLTDTGTAALGITTPVSITGLVNCSVTPTQPAASVAAGAATTLVLAVNPTAAGAWSCVVSVANTDAHHNPATWTVQGSAAAAAGGPVTIMAMGDSITAGADYQTHAVGGYRDPLYHDLVADGVSFTFIGASNANPSAALSAAGDTYHNGYGFYRIDNLADNINGNVQPNPGDGNQGGYWLTGGNGTGRAAMAPTYLLLQIGANDILQHFDSLNASPSEAQFRTDMQTRLHDLVVAIHGLCPNTVILVAGTPPFNNSAADDDEILAYDTWIANTLVPSLGYTRYVDNYHPFLNADNSVNGALLGADNVHPTVYGYAVIALDFADALAHEIGATPAGYALQVDSGSGGGTYPAGTVVTVAADAALANQQFQNWTPASAALYNPYAAVTTVTMPAAATHLTPVYASTGSPIIPDGVYQVVSYYDGLSMTAAGTGDGQSVQQQTYLGTAAQQWQVTNLSAAGTNVVKLTLVGTNEALEVAGGSLAGEAILDVNPYADTTSQQWTVTLAPDRIELVNLASGMNVTVDGYSTASGGQLVQDPGNVSPAIQTWAFYPVPSGGAAPVIASAATATGTVGSAFTYQIAASNGPTGFNATGLPAGLSVDTGSGAITGTPTAAGTSMIIISASNGTGTGTATLTITVNPAGSAPVITSAGTGTATVGAAYTYQITASNGPTGFNASGLPTGLSVDTGTGLITGTPTASGTSTITLSAGNGNGTGTATLTLTIDPAVAPAPTITSALTASATAGSAFSYQITASNGPITYFNATGLPAGLAIDNGTGAITGTLTTTGTSAITISAGNGNGTGTATLTLTVNAAPVPAPVISSALTASATAGSAFSYQIAATNSPTGFNASGLPNGLGVNTTTGAITGTPTTTGVSAITISAGNGGGTGNATLTLTVNAAPGASPVITSAHTASATAGSAFNYQITASNVPTGFNATGLPAGLTVDTTTGAISGTPTTAGVSTVSISAGNASGSGSATLTVTVNAAAGPSPVITSAGSASATAASAFSYQITASNGPTGFSAVGLPPGLTLNATSGAITGTPTAAGTSAITLGASNANGTGHATLTLTVVPLSAAAPVITSTLSASTMVGTAFTYQITASNNPTGFSATGLPTGLTLNAATGAITGTASAAGTSTVVIGASNAAGSGTATLTLSVAPVPVATLVVTRTGATIADGATDSVAGSAPGGAFSVPYTLADTGGAALGIALPVTVASVVNCTVAVTQPAPSVGAGSSTTLILAVTPAAAGPWSCAVSFATSDPARPHAGWTVAGSAASATGPTISAIASQVVPIGAGTGALAFTVADGAMPASALVVTAASSNPTLAPMSAIVLAGNGAARTVSVTPAAGYEGFSTITLTVSDGTASASTAFAVVTSPGRADGQAIYTAEQPRNCGLGGGLALVTVGLIGLGRRSRRARDAA